MTLTDFLLPLDLDTHIRMAKADADLIYFGPAGDLPLPVMQQYEVIESERFYEFGSSKRRGNTFYGTKAEAEQAEALSVERYKAKSKTSPYIDLTDRYLPLAVSIVKKRTGCTRVQKANVRIHKDSKGYIVSYRNELYRLH